MLLEQCLRVHFGQHTQEHHWTGEPEDFCMANVGFFKVVFPIFRDSTEEKLTKDTIRQAVAGAFPGVTPIVKDTVASKIIACWRWAKRKAANVKSGTRTHQDIKDLIALVVPKQQPGQAEVGLPLQAASSSTEDVTACQPKKRKLLHCISEPDPEAIQQMYRGQRQEPEQAADVEEISSSSQADTLLGQDVQSWWSMEDNCLVRQDEEGELEKANMEKGKDGFAIAVWADGTKNRTDKTNLLVFETPTAVAAKIQAKPRKKPAAAAKSQSSKKPAAVGGDPAKVLPVTGIRVAQGAWIPSVSFGFLKPTYAKNKSYIVFKESLGQAKPTCLVNIMGTNGLDHAAVCAELLEFCKGAGLDKAAVVAERDGIIARGV